MASMKLNIKSSSGGKFMIHVENYEETVAEFKGRLADLSGIPKESQRVIYRGHILSDNQTFQELVDQQKLQDGHTIHLVRGVAPASSKPPAAAQGAAATTGGGANGESVPVWNGAGVGAVPGAGTGGAGAGMGGMANMGNFLNSAMQRGATPEGFAELQQQMDPTMMREIMDLPMIRNLMDNPELMRRMILANPQIQQLREQNPERQALEVARNPSLMNEVLRNTDRQMANIEMMPEGFNALRNMYQNVQAPLTDAVDAAINRPPPSQNDTDANNDNPFTSLFTPSAQPMPNPWNPTPNHGTGTAAGTGNATTGQTNTATNGAANPFASMFGGPGGQTGGAGGMGGLGGLGGMGGLGNLPEGLDPENFLQIMESPGVQQMLQDPRMVEMMMRNNPEFQRLAQDNPNFAEYALGRGGASNAMSFAVEGMRAMLRQRQGAGAQTNTAADGTTGATQAANPDQASTGTQSQGDMAANLSRLFQAMQRPSEQAQQLTPEQVEERYQSQLTQLQDMGFFDRQMCIQALQETGGNVSLAVERLLTRLG